MSRQAVDGGISYYGGYSNGWPTANTFWPRGVWLQSVNEVNNIDRDKALGFNTYFTVADPEGSSSNLSYLQSQGMYCYLQQNELNRFTIPNPSPHVGYGLSDELDMTLGETAYITLQQEKDALPQDNRAVYTNFGKGCLYWQADVDARRHPAVPNIISADAYPYSDLDCAYESQGGRLRGITGRDLTPAESEHPYMYGLQVERMRFLVDYAKPVIGVAECGYAGTNAHRSPTPDQVKAALWHMVIAGARGVLLFVHAFGGGEGNASSDVLDLPASPQRDYPATRSVVQTTFTHMNTLAPVLNSPSVLNDEWSTTGDVTCRVKAGPTDAYLFLGHKNAGGSFTFNMPQLGNRTISNVLAGGTATVTGGTLSGTLADANDVRVYNLGPISTPVGVIGRGRAMMLGMG